MAIFFVDDAAVYGLAGGLGGASILLIGSIGLSGSLVYCLHRERNKYRKLKGMIYNVPFGGVWLLPSPMSTPLTDFFKSDLKKYCDVGMTLIHHWLQKNRK